MLQIRKSEERGLGDHGWLNSRHTFSFAGYYDPSHMGFRSLRVINEDRIAGGSGFGKHPHRDMEIISYVVSGGLQHEDSMGNKAVIRPGDVQRMSAGTGVLHAEYNASPNEEAHFFQIWIMPNSPGGAPGYGQKSFEQALNENDRVLVVSKDGREGSIAIKQDADLYISRLREGRSFDFQLRPKRGAWIQVVKGQIKVGEEALRAGDALSFADGEAIVVSASEDSELMLFDLA